MQYSRLKEEGITRILKVNGLPGSILSGEKETKIVSLEDSSDY